MGLAFLKISSSISFLFISFLFLLPFFPGEKLSGVLDECQPYLDVFQVDLFF